MTIAAPVRTRRLLTVREATEFLHIAAATGWAMCREGTMPGLVKVGGRYRVQPERLDEWLRAGGGVR